MRSGPGLRRWVGALMVVGGIAILLAGAGSAVAALALSRSDGTPPSATFSAGETVTAPEGSDLFNGPLLVYGVDGAVDGSRTLALGCDVVSPGGSDRVVTSTGARDAVEVQGRSVVPLVEAGSWKPGDEVTCSGPQASAFAPLALGVAPAPTTAVVVGGVLSVAAVLGGVALLVVGAVAVRAR